MLVKVHGLIHYQDLDAEGNELTKTDTLPIDSTETSATILGVNIDVSQVKNLQGDATWTL